MSTSKHPVHAIDKGLDKPEDRARSRARARDARAQEAAAAATAVDTDEIQQMLARRRSRTRAHEAGGVEGGPQGEGTAGLVQPPPNTAGIRRTAPRTQIRPSPYQPPGRPSEAARAEAYGAVRKAGSLDLLLDQAGEPHLNALSAEARDLVELAADIEHHGLREPLVVRQVAGGFELISGHRRLVATELAEVETVPVLDRGVLSEEEAELEVARANGLRVNFTAWQEAKITGALSRRLAAGGGRTDHRSIGKALGFSHTKVGHMLAILASWPESLLAQLGNGNPAMAEEKLAAIGYRTLLAWSKLPIHERLAVGRSATGLLAPDAAPAPGAVRLKVEERGTRGGGWAITVRGSPERLPNSDLTYLRERLAQKLAEVDAARQTRGLA